MAQKTWLLDGHIKYLHYEVIEQTQLSLYCTEYVHFQVIYDLTQVNTGGYLVIEPNFSLTERQPFC